MTSKPELYFQVVEITSDYLGPAAQRFIDRHILNHLDIEPIDLKHDDMSELIDWLRISVAFLTEDRSIINEMTVRLRQLSSKPTD